MQRFGCLGSCVLHVPGLGVALSLRGYRERPRSTYCYGLQYIGNIAKTDEGNA